MTRKTKKGRIPAFKSIEEEAAFWDTHDTADFEDEFTPVQVQFAKSLSESLTVRFDPKTLHDLQQAASKKGIGPTTLIRMWVLEQLNRHRPENSEAKGA